MRTYTVGHAYSLTPSCAWVPDHQLLTYTTLSRNVYPIRNALGQRMLLTVGWSVSQPANQSVSVSRSVNQPTSQ